jgi:CBS domain-containing protein
MKVSETIRDILRFKGQEVWSIGEGSSVYEAVEMMADKHVGALLVLSGDELAGVISERDYMCKVILKGRSSRATRVGEIMSSPVIFADPGHAVEECMKTMTAKRIRHLPVVENGKVIGVVSIGDLVRSIISTQDHTIQRLQEYISGQY